jgi:putative sigma-54 modulation protein
MQLSITGRSIDVTDYTRDYIEKRLQRVTRHLPSLHEARVELIGASANGNGQRNVVQVTLRAGGKILRSEERASDLFTAVDAVMEKLVRQVDRFKGKRMQRRHTAQAANENTLAAAVLAEEALAEADEAEAYRPIVKTKRFHTAPMQPAEAIEQMELLGHNFFVFYNAQDGQINVIYRRHDGDYGLLIPELG